MDNILEITAAANWLAAALLSAWPRGQRAVRALLGLGAVALIVLAVVALPDGGVAGALPMTLLGGAIIFQLSPTALWLMGFGLAPALLAALLATPRADGRRGGWLFGVSLILLGAFGVFGLQDGAAFLIAWEIMSLGGGVMIVNEHLSRPAGGPTLFMLALLEVGSVALLAAIILLSAPVGTLAFTRFAAGGAALGPGLQIVVGGLFLIGFGAKLGVLPFYEWFPAAYGSGSGASGAILSGVVLNAAFFGLSRAVVEWLPGTADLPLGMILIVAAVISAVLAVLYAFQQDDWRKLLSFSSAENASIAVAVLGAALLFRDGDKMALASLAWTVALLHLAGHALAKGSLFLAADGIYRRTGSYLIVQRGLFRKSSWLFGIGALFAAMSLAAMPPQAGFVSEWYVFQTVFQGFQLPDLGSRLVLSLAGAGLALTAAVAFATFVKVFGLGLQGDGGREERGVRFKDSAAVGVLGGCVLGLAVGLPWWLESLTGAVALNFHTNAAVAMHQNWILVPLRTFAFISPTLLVIVGPLFALLPLALLLRARRYAIRRQTLWFGGAQNAGSRAATTALAFSNALRTFYSFVYRPTVDMAREHHTQAYFLKRLKFTHRVAPIFGPGLFTPLRRAVLRVGDTLQALQSGYLNFYLFLIGLLLAIILITAVAY